MMMDPSARYLADLSAGNILPDPVQQEAVSLLQQLYQHLQHEKKLTFTRFRLRYLLRRKPPPKGLYLWGGVGIGKTYLMDIFYESLPYKQKWRIHFHPFMQQVQAYLKSLRGQTDPLKIVAEHFAARARVICLDEFFVNDIADAMILSALLSELFKRRVVIVTTSNTPPDNLYQNGLQRQRFLPAIALLKAHVNVHHLASQQDYRLHQLKKRGVYFTPLDDQAQANMQACFDMYAHHDESAEATLHIGGRHIETVRLAPTAVWLDFSVLCQSPRSQQDYLVLAQRFQVILLANIPVIASEDYATITRFIHLIDILYDSHTEVIFSAAVPVAAIYQPGKQPVAWSRALSRLQEMQSVDYLRHCGKK